MLTCHLFIFFGDVFVKIFYPFLEIGLSLIIEVWEF